MPIHDWTKVIAAVFHDFHQTWLVEIKRALNDGLLPSPYYALAEQVAGEYGPDVLALEGPRMATKPPKCMTIRDRFPVAGWRLRYALSTVGFTVRLKPINTRIKPVPFPFAAAAITVWWRRSKLSPPAIRAVEGPFGNS